MAGTTFSECEERLLLLVQHVPDDGPPRQHDVRHERLHRNALDSPRFAPRVKDLEWDEQKKYLNRRKNGDRRCLPRTRVARWFVFKPKIPIWVNLLWKILLYFMTIRPILWPLEIFCGHLVYFVVIWYIFPRFGILDEEKSGNPATHCE
jgi:hypothetical protein